MSKEPLTEANVNLRMLDCMMIKRSARNSEFVMGNDPAVIGLGLIMWLAAWEQVPAGSLPSDDRTLAGLAGFGRNDMASWLECKDKVLDGWIKCDDGRLYHPVMAEVVNTAWVGHRQSLYQRRASTFNKRNQRNPKNKIGVPTFEQWCEAGCPDDLNDVLGLDRPKRGRIKLEANIPASIEPTGVGGHDDDGDDTFRDNQQLPPDGEAAGQAPAPKKPTADEVREAQATEVVEYYKTRLGHEGILPKTAEGYVKRIKVYLQPAMGYTVEHLRSIIDHARSDPWLSGANGGKKYQGFETILGSRTKLDKYLTNIHQNKQKEAGNGAADQRSIETNTAKRAAYIAQGCTINSDGTVYSNTGSIIDRLT